MKQKLLKMMVQIWYLKSKKDFTIIKYQALEKFETCRRLSDMTILTFLNEFDKHLSKFYGTIQSGDILAYKLLKLL